MGRPSKLAPAQWSEIERRLVSGESARAAARAFNISEGAIRRRLCTQTAQVRRVAEKLADVQADLAKLPVALQYRALELADALRATETQLAAAARLGAATAHRLAAQAHAAVQRPGPLAPATLESVEHLFQTANRAAASGLAFLHRHDRARRNDSPPQSTGAEIRRIETAPMKGPTTT
jgi:hypothetical protein